jgi:hypothetical protein
MVFGLALIGFFVALFPLASYLLVIPELYLLYNVAEQYHAFDLWQFLGAAASLVSASVVLKTFAHALHFLPLAGQFINGAFAFVFILLLNVLANEHFSHLHLHQ